MDFGSGGYVLVRLPNDLAFESVGEAKVITVGSDIVAKLTQFEKPVLFEHFYATIMGARVDMLGYSTHSREEGVHTHYIGGFVVAVAGDTQIRITISG